MKKTLLVLTGIAFTALTAQAQQFPIYNQFLYDPYLVNPAFIAPQGSELNLLYRQQWSGFNDSPATAVVNFQHRINNKLALGVNLMHDQVVLLNSTAILGTFGYRIPVSRKSLVSFGLSTGVYTNRIDLQSADDPTDPLLVQAKGDLQLDGQVGVAFTGERLRIGLSLLHLFDNNAFTSRELTQLQFNEFKNRLLTVSYRLPLGPRMELTPHVLYRYNGNFSYFEAHASLEYQQRITLGAFYRQSAGIGVILRFKLQHRATVGYGHEFSPAQMGSFSTGTHEFQLKYPYGPKWKQSVAQHAADSLSEAEQLASSDSDPIATQTLAQQPREATSNQRPPVQERTQEVLTESIQQQRTAAIDPVTTPTEQATTAQKVLEPVEKPQAQQEGVDTQGGRVHEKQVSQTKTQETLSSALTKSLVDSVNQQVKDTPTPTLETYSLVIGSFKSSTNAIDYIRSVKAKGFTARIVYRTQTRLYYVYLPEYEVPTRSVEQLLQVRKTIPFPDAWYLLGLTRMGTETDR